ncbi:MAG: peptidase S10 [Rhodopila sp.]|nr:peptidase S10 [Rhodopila sp.]
MKQVFLAFVGLAWVLIGSAHAQRADTPHEPEVMHLPADVTTHQVLDLPGRILRFTATAGSIRLRDGKDAPLADIAFVAYQAEGADVATRPVTFVFNGGPGMASAWLQMGAIGPWRVRLDPGTDGPSAPAVPVPNAETWLGFTDLVFIDPPGTGYSRILATDADARRRLWSVGGDIDTLAEVIRRWLDHSGRIVSPKYIVGESYGGFRGPRLARKLQADEGVGISGLVLLSPLLDSHDESGFADPLSWADLLPSEVAVARAQRGPVARTDMADVEAYAAGDYLVDMLRGEQDATAIDRLTARVASLTGLDPALVRRMRGRLDARVFQQSLVSGRVGSVYDGTIMRPNPTPRQLSSQFPDPVLDGFAAPVTSAMLAVYADKLNWRPDLVYHLSNDAAFEAWDWGHGMGRPESLSALQAARSVDPHMRVLIAHGLFDLRTPYFGTARMLRMLPALDGAAPIELRAYPGGHMFYFGDSSRAALRDDAKAVFDTATATGGTR